MSLQEYLKRFLDPLHLRAFALVSSASFLLAFIFFAGCAAGPLRNARNEFYSGRFQGAADTLAEVKGFQERDRLLFFMEKGLVLHRIGQYKQSIKELLQASHLMEEQDVISVSQQTASLVTTELITEYKGEFSERLWVHTYLMMNYLLIHKYEDALVEGKQALKILMRYPEPLADDYFTRALIALCFENLLEINDAYIEYKRLAELMHEPSPVASQLYRLGLELGFTREAEQYKAYIPKKSLPLLRDRTAGELILFAGLGRSPIKIPGNIVIPPSIRFSFPTYKDRSSTAAEIRVFDSKDRLPAVSITTDLNKVSRASLQDRAAKMIAKETARVVTKEVIAEAVERENRPVVGALVRLALFFMEEPDTRCWQTLPASITLVRVPLRPGTHNIKAVIVGKNGDIIEETVLPQLRVSSGQKVYHSIRALGG